MSAGFISIRMLRTACPIHSISMCFDATKHAGNGSCGSRRDRLDLEDGLQEVSYNLVLALLSGPLNLLDLSFGLLICLFLGCFVSLGVLGDCQHQDHIGVVSESTTDIPQIRTS